MDIQINYNENNNDNNNDNDNNNNEILNFIKDLDTTKTISNIEQKLDNNQST